MSFKDDMKSLSQQKYSDYQKIVNGGLPGDPSYHISTETFDPFISRIRDGLQESIKHMSFTYELGGLFKKKKKYYYHSGSKIKIKIASQILKNWGELRYDNGNYPYWEFYFKNPMDIQSSLDYILLKFLQEMGISNIVISTSYPDRTIPWDKFSKTVMQGIQKRWDSQKNQCKNGYCVTVEESYYIDCRIDCDKNGVLL